MTLKKFLLKNYRKIYGFKPPLNQNKVEHSKKCSYRKDIETRKEPKSKLKIDLKFAI